jgi:hypothetical protein
MLYQGARDVPPFLALVRCALFSTGEMGKEKLQQNGYTPKESIEYDRSGTERTAADGYVGYSRIDRVVYRRRRFL